MSTRLRSKVQSAVTKVCKTCRRPGESDHDQQISRARLLNIIRYLSSKTGMDPFLRNSLEIDAPELLAEHNELTRSGNIGGDPNDVIQTMGPTEALVVPGPSGVVHGAQGVTALCEASEETANEKNIATQVPGHTTSTLPTSELLPFSPSAPEEVWNEQFDALVRDMKADDIYPMSPPDMFPDASKDSWRSSSEALHQIGM